MNSSPTFHNPFYYEVTRHGVRWFALLVFRFRVHGARPRRVPGGPGLVIAANHQSFLDPLFLGVAAERPVSFMARDTLFRNPMFGAIIRGLGTFAVRREGVGKEGLREAARRLRAGEAVIVFPEGTRSRDGSLQEFKQGATLMARLGGVAVLPAAVHGTWRAWPRGRLLPRAARVRVAFGPEIPAGRIAADPDGAQEALGLAVRSLHHDLDQMPF